MKKTIGMVLLAFTAACSSETTVVRRFVSPNDAAVHDPNAHVVAVEHADGRLSKHTTHVGPDDRIVVEVPGTGADTTKGETVVTYRESKPMMIAGVSLIGAGAGVAAIAAGCRDTAALVFGEKGFCIGELIAAGSSLVITGAVLLIAGIHPHAYVHHPERPQLRIAPTFEAHGGGGALSLTF